MVRTYETSKARADKAEQYSKSAFADRKRWNEKTQVRGNFMRPVQKSQHKQQPVHHKQTDEFHRVTAQIT